MEPRLHKVTITHHVMVHSESPTHAEKIVRLHLKDREAEWQLAHEIADCADVFGHQTVVTNEDNLAEGYRDVSPWSDTDESRTCSQILDDERAARAAQPAE